ncbi:hypothetical protein F4811DRAFT_239299 [Daldinia bambusicola]|nr:hypothetical protein F4811DRAFT_239299 [Daldinia bambusicola]
MSYRHMANVPRALSAPMRGTLPPQADRLGNTLVLQSTYSYNIVIIVIGVNADAVIRRLSKTIATKHAHGDLPSLSYTIVTKVRKRHRSITTPFSPLAR